MACPRPLFIKGLKLTIMSKYVLVCLCVQYRYLKSDYILEFLAESSVIRNGNVWIFHINKEISVCGFSVQAWVLVLDQARVTIY